MNGTDNAVVKYGSFVDFDYLKLSIASPEKILSWSYGEITNADTVNYRTLRPEKGGLFCTRIFGPVRDYECSCGKYKKVKYKGIRCEKCDVDVVSSQVRRERMGHIKLVYPVLNILYLKSVPSKLSVLLGISSKDIELVLYFNAYIVIDPCATGLSKYDILTQQAYTEAIKKYGEGSFVAGIGGAGLKQLLESFDLEKERASIVNQLEKVKSAFKVVMLKKRLGIIDDFITSGNRPEWMFFTVLPVLPPDLRPLVEVSGGKMAISDLNHFYALIINRNNRLKKLMDAGAPELLLNSECCLLQEAVNSLLSSDSNAGSNNREQKTFKSISDFLKGKQGRLRQNLLGKRVDYSGRSVIVSGPELKLHECGLPKIMALELFKPFVLAKLRLTGVATTIRSGLNMIKSGVPEVYDALESVVREHPVLLNRAPTLHRTGIQAFEPKLIELKAIQLHPLVCRAFNADFDGDQMAVHIPLSIEAQIEARVLMLSSNNILSSANGLPTIVPRKDITVGLYYMSCAFDKEKGEGHAFYSYNDVMVALQNGSITVNTKIKYYYRYSGEWMIDEDDVERVPVDNDVHCLEETTAGRIKLFSFLPMDGQISFDYLNRPWSVGFLGEVVLRVYKVYGPKITVVFCDHLMKEGFKYATLSGVSFGKDDVVVPDDKNNVIAEILDKVMETDDHYKDGYITARERYNRVTDYWAECTDRLCDEVMLSLKKNENNANINSITLMMNSGARASKAQMKQLAGMKGLIAKPNGDIIETPVLSNFKEGLTVMEYFNAAHGARKGNVDTALKTADAGYLTRRLVGVAQDCIVSEDDCGSDEGIKYSAKVQDGRITEKLSSIIRGRFLAKDVLDKNGNVLLKANSLVDDDAMKLLDDNNITFAFVRSPVCCKCRYGICAKCYGLDLSTLKIINIGEAVGVIAAQTIGEPGTQLTLNTFHVGGVASKKIAESTFEASADGKVKFDNVNFVTNKDGDNIVVSHSSHISIVNKSGDAIVSKDVPYSAKLYVKDGDTVSVGDKIADWDPYNIYIIAENSGKVKLNDLILNVSYINKYDGALGENSKVVTNWLSKGISLKPSILIEDGSGKAKMNTAYLVSVGAVVHVEDGDYVNVGDCIAKVPRDSSNVVKDITGGLPRVEELFEARIPAESAVIAGEDGVIEFGSETKNFIKVILHPSNTELNDIVYSVGKGKYLAVYNGGKVKKGDIIVSGSMNPHDILRFQGVGAVTSYLVQEVQAVYRMQGIEIDGKHIEVIVKYMLSKGLVDEAGDTGLTEGYQYDYIKLLEKNEEMEKQGLKPAKFHRLLYGISKSSLQTESFISAASFQETIKVLVDAAIKGKKDYLRGMKESMIVGRLIPAGTGFVTRQLKYKASKILGDGEKTVSIDSI